jgi:hypothetical protein
MADAPLSGRDGESYSSDLGFGKTEIFLQRGLDRENHQLAGDLPDGLSMTPVG